MKFADKFKKVHITFKGKELAHNNQPNPMKNRWTPSIEISICNCQEKQK